ncbi:transglycosylase SLT domain-containing protein [Bacteriovoracaceae bacterium]|nr:transglycosylase SLT domain-containing protein [Bacteriovoracaceae bacterium]
MKSKYITLLSVILISFGCSTIHQSKENDLKNGLSTGNSDKSNQVDQVKELAKEPTLDEKVAKLINSNSMCSDCIPGSSSNSEEEYGDGHRKVFYLYGAEELNLTNYYFDLPVVYNSSVRKWIKYFSKGRGKDLFARYATRASYYAPHASKILKEYGLPRDIIYLAMAESGYTNTAKSHAKAMGPWQFMKFTGKKYGLKVDWHVDERRDPLKAAESAAKYLKDLHKLFGSWELALAGYNAGEGKVGRAIRRYRTKNFWKIAKRRYLRSETRNYVPKIMALAIIGNNLSSFGFENIEIKHPWKFETIKVGPRTDLYKFSEVTGIKFEELKELNPELLRWETPWGEDYQLRIPQTLDEETLALIEDASKTKSSNYMIYKLKSYANLKDVARKFRLSANLLGELNEIPIRRKMSPHSTVKLPFYSSHSIRHRMYGDLYERPRRFYSKRRRYKRIVKRALKRGKKISNPSQYYVVRKGDSLWSVARKTGTKLNTLIRSNSHILNRRMIVPGDKLAIK